MTGPLAILRPVLPAVLLLIAGLPAPAGPAGGEPGDGVRLLLDGGAVLDGTGPLETRGSLLHLRLDDGRLASVPAASVVEVLSRPHLPPAPAMLAVPLAVDGPVPGAAYFTNASLPAEEGLTLPSVVPLPTLPQRPPRTVEPTTDEAHETTGEAPAPDPRATRTYWRARMDSLQERLAATRRRSDEVARELWEEEQLVACLEQALDPGERCRPQINRINRVNRNRSRTLRERQVMARLQTSEEGRRALEQAIRDLREEARRAGIPPGWLR